MLTYISGIVAGILVGAGFPACAMAHWVAMEEVKKADQHTREQMAFFSSSRGTNARDHSIVRGAVSDAVGSAVTGMAIE
jgi:hypothetical protein